MNNEVKGRGLPTNIAYVADDARPVDGAVAAAGVARVGGIMLLTPAAGTAAADKQIDQLGLTGAVDKVVVVKSTSSASPPWVLIVVSVLFAALGVALLALAARRKRFNATEAATAAPTTSPAREPRSERRP